MLGSVAVLERPIVRRVRPVPYLRLVPMPEATATFLGRLYAKAPPEGRLPHPQDKPLWESREGLFWIKELWCVANSEVNGVFAIKVSEKADSQKVLLSEAEKNKGDLQKRENLAYGRDEVDLELHPIPRNSELWNRFVRSFQKASPDTKFEFV